MNTPRILIIDDSALILERLRIRLSAEGWDVMTTTQTVGTARYLPNCDVVIVDFHMPGIDGGAVLASLRAASENAGSAPSFYLYTSDDQKAALFRKYGFDGVFTQKGDDDALVRQVSAALRMNRLRDLTRNRSSAATPPLVKTEPRK